MNRATKAASATLGGALLVRGLRRRSLGGAVMALGGGWLVSRALGGNERIRRALDSRSPTGRSGRRTSAKGVEVSSTVIVGKPAEELYESWRDPDQFARIMGGFAEVTPAGDDRLRWTVHGPRDRGLSWETLIVEDEPGEVIRWETPADATLPSEGTVRFRQAPGDRGTAVTLSVTFDPPGGALADGVIQRFDFAPEALAREALRRSKRLAENGEIPTLEGNPSARGRGEPI